MTSPPTAPTRLTIAAPEAQLDDSTMALRGRAGEVLLDTMLRLGWTAPYACRRGGCGACLVRLHHGRVRHGPHTERALRQFGEPGERKALACRAVPTTSVVEVEFYGGKARRVMSLANLGHIDLKEPQR